jgi:hypothetical protein
LQAASNMRIVDSRAASFARMAVFMSSVTRSLRVLIGFAWSEGEQARGGVPRGLAEKSFDQ